MKNWCLFILPLVVVLGCNRPDTISVTPTPPKSTADKEPLITEVRQAFDSIGVDGQYIQVGTATPDVSFQCDFRINTNRFTKANIREVGFCLSATDSVLSITNPQHIRLKAAIVTDAYQFTATTATLLPNQYYYLEPYFVLNDGRVYYSRYLPVPRLQTPSWLPRPAFNSITRFKINQLDRSVYSPVTIRQRATLPPVDRTYKYYLFISNDRLHVLDRDGSLFQYDADQDKWVSRKKLSIEPSGSFNGYPAVVFGLNNRGYILYTDALFPNPTNYWEYDARTDQWTKLSSENKPAVAPYKYTYQVGNQAILTDTYGKKVVRFDTAQNAIQTIDRPNLLEYVSAGASLLTLGNQPYAIFTDPNTRKVTVTAYSPGSDQFSDGSIVSERPTDRGAVLRLAQNNDLLIGLGYTGDLLGDSRIISYLYQYSEDLVRYDLQRKQLTARYDISAVRSNKIYDYQSIMIGNKPYVIAVTTGQMWELQF